MKMLLPVAMLLVLAVAAHAEGAASIAGAEAAAGSWLQLVDDGKYDKSWEMAAELFKQRVTQDRWQATIKGARDSFGALVARVRTTAASVRTLPGVPDGDYVVLHYTTSFVKKKDADETLTQSRAADGVWRMVGYSLR